MNHDIPMDSNGWMKNSQISDYWSAQLKVKRSSKEGIELHQPDQQFLLVFLHLVNIVLTMEWIQNVSTPKKKMSLPCHSEMGINR